MVINYAERMLGRKITGRRYPARVRMCKYAGNFMTSRRFPRQNQPYIAFRSYSSLSASTLGQFCRFLMLNITLAPKQGSHSTAALAATDRADINDYKDNTELQVLFDRISGAGFVSFRRTPRACASLHSLCQHPAVRIAPSPSGKANSGISGFASNIGKQASNHPWISRPNTRYSPQKWLTLTILLILLILIVR